MSNELHTREVVHFCLRLLESVDGNRHIVIPAAILHDMEWAKIPEKVSHKVRVSDGNPESIRVHEEISALIAERILKDGVKNWFFLPESRKTAGIELCGRIQEDEV